MIYLPVVQRRKYNPNTYVERVLPAPGELTVKVGEKVKPTDQIGKCFVSYEITQLPRNFKPINKAKSTCQKNELVGKYGFKNFFAPYNGFLENGVYKSQLQEYPLLPGVWGTVISVVKDRSVLIKTASEDISFVASTRGFSSGELIVFPNPSEILELQYLDKFMKSARGKIVYVGNKITKEVVRKSVELQVSCILGGSIDRLDMSYAIGHKLNVGIFSGFGDLMTPEDIYFFLNDVNHRYVFFDGNKNKLMVPIDPEKPPKNERPANTSLKPVKKGVCVQVTTTNRFLQSGVVDRVSGNSIFVEFADKKVEQVDLPFVFAIN